VEISLAAMGREGQQFPAEIQKYGLLQHFGHSSNASQRQFSKSNSSD
jgi:hypothetical protein